MGKPQSSGRCGKGSVTQPLGLGVATVGVQRQVDRPTLEADASEQGRDLIKIIGTDPMSLHRCEYLDQDAWPITTPSQQFQVVQSGHGSDHRRVRGEFSGELTRWIPRIQDHHITRERLAYDANFGGHADSNRVRTESDRLLGQPAQAKPVTVALDHRDDAWGRARHGPEVLPPTLPIQPQGHTAHVVNTTALITDVSCRGRKPCTAAD